MVHGEEEGIWALVACAHDVQYGGGQHRETRIWRRTQERRPDVVYMRE